MPVACQIVKPACLVIGMMERHTGLGLTPIGIPAPNPNTFWMSIFTIYNSGILGDEKSSSVYSNNSSSFIKRAHDSKHMRPHIVLFSIPPIVVPPVADLGLMAVVIALGSAKTMWGPFSIKAEIADSQNPAVVLVPPGSFVGIANFLLCSDPVAIPNLVNVQVPNTVFAGMAPGDIVGCLVAAALDMALSFLLDKIMEWGPIKGVVGKVSAYLGAKLSGVLGKVLSQKAMKFLTRVYLEEEAEKEVKKAVEKVAEKAVEKEAEKEVEIEVMRPMTKLVQKKIGKIVEWGVGKAGTTGAIDHAGDASKELTEEHFGEGESEGHEPGEAGSPEPHEGAGVVGSGSE
jgi:hypothetical protein